MKVHVLVIGGGSAGLANPGFERTGGSGGSGIVIIAYPS